MKHVCNISSLFGCSSSSHLGKTSLDQSFKVRLVAFVRNKGESLLFGE